MYQHIGVRMSSSTKIRSNIAVKNSQLNVARRLIRYARTVETVAIISEQPGGYTIVAET